MRADTSPLLYLGRIGALGWLDQLFGSVWVPSAVLRELDEGRVLGFEVPVTDNLSWLETVDPKSTPFLRCMPTDATGGVWLRRRCQSPSWRADLTVVLSESSGA